jgi:hypothetical protein
MRPLHVQSDGTLWASRGMKVFRSTDQARSFQSVARHKGNFVQRLSRASRLFDRFTRSGFQGLLPLPDGSCLATIRGSILKLDPGSESFREVFRIRRGSRPLNICLHPDGRLFWGEYFFNHDRDEVHIYASDDAGDSWEVAHTFPSGEIRHVHGIFYDTFRGGCWILTGDEGKESKILFTADPFNQIDTVFEGSQLYRNTFLIPRADRLITATDTPFEQNYILAMDPQQGTVDKVQEITGSAFFGCSVGGWAVVSVGVEPSRVNTSKFASLWISADDERWRELHNTKRDMWHVTPYSRFIPDYVAELPLLQNGIFVLPSGESKQSVLYAYGQALKGHDNELMCWDLDQSEHKQLV